MTKKNVIAALEKIGVTDQEKQAEFFRALKKSNWSRYREATATSAIRKLITTAA